MYDVLAWSALALVLFLLALRVHPRSRRWAVRGSIRWAAPAGREHPAAWAEDRAPAGAVPPPRPAHRDSRRTPVGSSGRR